MNISTIFLVLLSQSAAFPTSPVQGQSEGDKRTQLGFLPTIEEERFKSTDVVPRNQFQFHSSHIAAGSTTEVETHAVSELSALALATTNTNKPSPLKRVSASLDLKGMEASSPGYQLAQLSPIPKKSDSLLLEALDLANTNTPLKSLRKKSPLKIPTIQMLPLKPSDLSDTSARLNALDLASSLAPKNQHLKRIPAFTELSGLVDTKPVLKRFASDALEKLTPFLHL